MSQIRRIKFTQLLKKLLLDIQPSAVEISEEIKKDGKLLRPIELKKNPDLNSKYPYLLVRGRMRYWGWVIAYGSEEKIECKLF